MHTRTLAVFALLLLPAGLSAQRGRRPGGVRGAKPEVAPLPQQPPGVARALAYKRSRWSGEGYGLVNTFQLRNSAGGADRYTILGSGTRADFRFSDRLSGTMDLTVSALGAPATSETGELGMRYTPLAPDRSFRPFFDARVGYMHLYDSFTGTLAGTSGPVSLSGGSRYSRGFGAMGGVGVEKYLTTKFALTTELSALQNRMSTYRFVGPATGQSSVSYWMTSYRFSVGLKYNPVTALHLAQKTPTS